MYSQVILNVVKVRNYFIAVSCILIYSHRSQIVFLLLQNISLLLCAPLMELLYCHKILLNIQHKVYTIKYGQHQEMLVCGIFTLKISAYNGKQFTFTVKYMKRCFQESNYYRLLSWSFCLCTTFCHLLSKIMLSYQADTPVLLFILL